MTWSSVMDKVKRALITPAPRAKELEVAQEMEAKARGLAWTSVRSVMSAADEFCRLVSLGHGPPPPPRKPDQ